MKMIRFFPLLAFLMIFGACQDEQRERAADDELAMREQPADPGEAINQWKDAWDQNDGQTLKDMMADDAVLMFNGQTRTDNDIHSWIDNSLSWMDGLETSVEAENREGSFAYEAGTFTAGVREGEGAEGETERGGTYTVIWHQVGDQNNQTAENNQTTQLNRTRQNNWKVKVLNITPRIDTTMVANQNPNMR